MIGGILNYFGYGKPQPTVQNTTSYTNLESKTKDLSESIFLDNCVVMPDQDCPKAASFLTSKFFNFVRDSSNKPANPEVIGSAMEKIGGSELKLKTTNGHMVNAMHFNYNDVQEKMKAGGMQKVVLSHGQNDVPAFVLDLNNPKSKELFQDLANLQFFSEGIWETRYIDGKVYIFSSDEAKRFNQFPSMVNNKLNPLIKESAPKAFEIDSSPKKTVVINGGLKSYLKSGYSAKDVAKYLSLGFNVVISEDKHDGLNNAESHSHVMANRAAIHQELKSRKVTNDDIIWAATCFSSAPAVECAAKYPGSHVIINQGYYDIKEVANSMTYLPSFLVNQGCKRFDFNFEMEPHLDKVQGNVIVIGNQHDSTVYKKQFEKIKDAVNKQPHIKKKFFEMDNPDAKHAAHWFRSESCNQQVVSYLQEQGFSKGNIIAR